MPLSGGAADKLGNLYELTWTANCIAEIIADRAEAIRLEPPGPEEAATVWSFGLLGTASENTIR